MRLAGQDGAEIEAEPIHMHLLHPVAEAVGHHLHDAGMAQIDGAPGAGVVDVVALLIGQQAIVGGVVDALQERVGPRSLPSAVWL